MKKQFSIFLLIFFVSANINAEISGVDIDMETDFIFAKSILDNHN